jgi:hypothetical protein
LRTAGTFGLRSDTQRLHESQVGCFVRGVSVRILILRFQDVCGFSGEILDSSDWQIPGGAYSLFIESKID